MDVSDVWCNRLLFPFLILFEHCVMMSMLCNCCVRELLILARTWFAFGLPSKTGCDTTGHCPVRLPRHLAVGFRLLELLSSRPPDRHCSLSGAPSVSALTLARTVAHLMPSADDRWREGAPLEHRTVWCVTGHCPVLHWTVRWFIAERPPEFPKVSSSELESLVHRTLSGAPDQGTLRLTLALYIWILSRSFYWFVVILWHL
jgi:hypothetical protein